MLNDYSREELQFAFDTVGMPTEEVRLKLPKILGFRWVYPLEIEKWWPWMIFLGTFRSHPTTGKEFQSAMDCFTCSQLLPNGDCAVYEDRPHFCKSYGVTIDCEHEGCTWTVGQAEREKLKKEKRDLEDQFLKEYKATKETVPLIEVPH